VTTKIALTYLLLAAAAAAFILPLGWMLSVSLKPTEEVLRPDLLPRQPTLAAYTAVTAREHRHDRGTPGSEASARRDAGRFDYFLYARNTLIIALLSLVGMVLSSAIAAYGFARIPFPGRNVLFGICLATMMIPFPVIMVPQYVIFQKLGWIGTFTPLWVPAWFGAAFNVFLLRQFFMGIPRDLEESAMLDGCSRWGCFWMIIMPLSRPALAVVALFHFLTVWNDLIGPLIYLSHRDQFTLALGLQFLQSRSGDTPWNQLMAAATLIILPLLALFLFAQRTFIRGIATTGLKG
jgi:multiple sugar transport system permease protein